MRGQWIGCTTLRGREELERALRSLEPHAHLVYARDAADMRCRLRDEEPHAVGAIVGLSDNGVSDVNLAAALVADGRAHTVVLVTPKATGSLRSRATHAGITCVISLDELPVPTFDGVGEEAPVTQPAASPAREGAPIVVFASGRGGVGKSALAATAAVTAGAWGLSVGLVDLDLACGNLPAHFGVGRWVDPVAASAEGEGGLTRGSVASAGVDAAHNVTLWGPCERPEMAELAMPLAGPLLGRVAAQTDLVIVDTSSTCTDAVAQALQMADRLVLVHGGEPGGIPSVARMSALAVRLGVARTRIVRIENGCPPRQLGAPFLPRAEVGLESARAFRVPDDGPDVRELLMAGKATELCEMGGSFVRAVSAVLAHVLQELGHLPDCEGARRAADSLRHRRGLHLFGLRKDVA